MVSFSLDEDFCGSLYIVKLSCFLLIKLVQLYEKEVVSIIVFK